jgi:hypothetical protein
MNCMNFPVSSHIVIESALVQDMTSLEDGEGEDKVESCARRESIWGSGGAASLILNLGTRWGERSTSGFGRFIPR